VTPASITQTIDAAKKTFEAQFPGNPFEYFFWMNILTASTRQTSNSGRHLHFFPGWPFLLPAWVYLAWLPLLPHSGPKKLAYGKYWALLFRISCCCYPKTF
jgi:hypothetical protein